MANNSLFFIKIVNLIKLLFTYLHYNRPVTFNKEVV